MADVGISDKSAETQADILTGWLSAAQERGDRYRDQLAACVTASDETAAAFNSIMRAQSERVRVLREALVEAEEFFDERADAEIIDSGRAIANSEMRLLMVVRAALDATK